MRTAHRCGRISSKHVVPHQSERGAYGDPEKAYREAAPIRETGSGTKEVCSNGESPRESCTIQETGTTEENHNGSTATKEGDR
jgi:hypothetical protein